EAHLKTLLDEKDSEATFWALVGRIELALLKTVASNGFTRTAARRAIADFRKLHTRAAAPRKWGSVYDTAVLVLNRYRTTSRGKTAQAQLLIGELLTVLRGFAHPSQ